MPAIRILLLAALLSGLSWFQLVNTASAAEVGRSMVDLLDSRPGRDVLFVGNSRMYVNDMPSMVRKIADSAGAPVKYRVRMWAKPGWRFTDHVGAAQVQALLDQRWDRVILQGNSGAHVDQESRAQFSYDGARLLEEAKQAGSPTSLIVGWTYGPNVFADDPPGTRESYHRTIQHDYRALAGYSGAGLIDVGTGWLRTEKAAPGLDLAPDGNHPSVYGTYLAALMVYAHLSGGGVDAVTFVPDGISEKEAATIRGVVDDLLASKATS
jgi:hypothetical protein